MGVDIPEKQCEHPLLRHMQAARDLGLTGTPMIITEKGAVISGYMPAFKLVEALESE